MNGVCHPQDFALYFHTYNPLIGGGNKKNDIKKANSVGLSQPPISKMGQIYYFFYRIFFLLHETFDIV